jgi:hypothetical protein
VPTNLKRPIIEKIAAARAELERLERVIQQSERQPGWLHCSRCRNRLADVTRELRDLRELSESLLHPTPDQSYRQQILEF